MKESLNKYKKLFANLQVKKTKGVQAPHKAIMLLTIMELYEKGIISDNIIPIEYIVADKFKDNWRTLVYNKKSFTHFSPNPWTPFWHLKNDFFWFFVPNNGYTLLDLEAIQPGQTPSVGKLRILAKHVMLEESLYHLIKSEEYRNSLKETLLNVYINCYE